MRDRTGRRRTRAASLSWEIGELLDYLKRTGSDIPIGCVQLLAFPRFVTQHGTYSRSQWKQMDTEEQIRLLVEEVGIETPVPAHFTHR